MTKRKFFILLLLLLDTGIIRTKSEFLHEMPADIQRFAAEKRLPHGGFTSFHISLPLHKDATGRLSPFHSQRLPENSSENDDIEIHLPFENETMILQLKAGFSVLHPSSSVSLSDGDKEEVITNGPFRNCYLCGHVVSHDGIASFSHCGDGLEGAMRTNELEFAVNVLPTNLAHRHRRSVEEQPYLVAKRATNYDLYSTNMELEMERLAGNVKKKVKREAENVTDLIVEIAVYADSGLTKSLESDNSMFSLQRKIDFVVTKYNGVQYEFWKYNELGGYNITIQLKKISFFSKDPMQSYRDDTIDAVLEAFCQWQQPRLPFDHVMLLSSKVVEKPGGRAYRPGVCKPDFRCAVSTIVHWGFWYIETHELGHNLGMDHNDNTDCRKDPTEKQGMMGKRRTGWSACSTKAFKTLISAHGAECLFEENIKPEMVDPNTIGIVLNGYLPGMYLTPDESCEARHGVGYRYRAYSELNPCMYHACVYMGTGPEYGTMKVHRYGLAGLYCGQNKICLLSLHCVEISSLNLKAPVIIQAGGWGEWGPWSNCIPSCGKGVRYRERPCTNPKPLNSPPCPGHRYMSASCEGQSCAPDKGDDLTVVLKKTIEICQDFLKQGKISNKYIGEGGLYGIDEYSVCEISCYPRSVSNYDRFDRFGLLPDGTPCRVLSTIPEPTRFKTQSVCIKGTCQDVGCDGNISGKKFDVCGVCGGTGLTCKRINGVIELQPQDVISEVLDIPGSASNIVIKFNLTTEDEAFLLLWSKDDVPVLDPGLNITKTLWDPIQFVNANWDYNSQSFITADGPTEQPVKIKVLIGINATARSLIYNYSLPLNPAVGNCPEKCYNNGNLSQCACKCVDYHGGRDCRGCNTVCINGGIIDEKTCTCKCPSPRMQPPRCECQKWYRGRNCSQCQFTPCGSCGTFSWETCRCVCQPGFGGANCESACKDKLGGEECLERAKHNECNANFPFMLENCEKTCTFCSVSDSLSPSCNPNISMKSYDKERDADLLSDTFFFETTDSHKPPECRSYEIPCDEKTCISLEMICDGQLHCPNGLDENDNACRALKILSGCPNTCGQSMMICISFLLYSIGHFLH